MIDLSSVELHSSISRTLPRLLLSPDSAALTGIMATSVDAKLLRKTKFPPEFSRKVDMTKVNIEVMKK